MRYRDLESLQSNPSHLVLLPHQASLKQNLYSSTLLGEHQGTSQLLPFLLQGLR